MNICSSCGVELENEVTQCPLCGSRGNYPSQVILLHKRESRKNIWELSGIIAFSGVIACTSVDLLIGKGLTWSHYADVSILSAWVILTILLRAWKKPVIALLSLMLTLLAMLYLFDLFSGNRIWFFNLGLPLTLAAFLTIGLIVLLFKIVRFKGFNLLGSGLFASSLFCIMAEIIIDNYLFESVTVRWSLIVTVSIFPIVMILFFAHYRMKKGRQLDSYFHI
jgi:hypothetical protein